MSSSPAAMRWLVAVDGGGSKIAIAAVTIGSLSGERRQWVFEGTGSAHPVTWPQAEENLCRAMDEVALELNRDTHQIVAVRLALAGAGRQEDQARVLEKLKGQCSWLQTVTCDCVGDIEPLVDEKTSGMQTMAVILGTGSIVASRNLAREIVRAGGWGPLLGDACSGGAIGLSALRYVSQLIDEGQTAEQFSGLARAIVERLGTLYSGKPLSLNSILIQTASDRTQTAALASIVLVRAYEEEDRDALELLKPHLADIVWQIRQVARRSGIHEQEIQINFTGGLAQYHAPLRQAIVQACHSAGLNAKSEQVVDPLECLLNQLRHKH